MVLPFFFAMRSAPWSPVAGLRGGVGAHKLGVKLQETAAEDELREKLGYSERR